MWCIRIILRSPTQTPKWTRTAVCCAVSELRIWRNLCCRPNANDTGIFAEYNLGLTWWHFGQISSNPCAPAYIVLPPPRTIAYVHMVEIIISIISACRSLTQADTHHIRWRMRIHKLAPLSGEHVNFPAAILTQCSPLC